ncbi:MAG: rubrerythrin family protein [Candidatus Bathyarchaeota archaeon]|nr:rubrerythrin family protein [Candidatus Bathyarchaeota archaeon]
MTKTEENLKAAFAGESQANRLYLSFAKKAEQEGLTQIAMLFKAAAEAETVHAHNHLRVLGQVKETQDNLGTAIAGETHEFKSMYPQFIEEAKTEGNKQALVSFDWANKVEQMHAELYQKALDALKNKTPIAKADYYVCPVCGATFEGTAPDRCPICGAPQKSFKKIE